MKHATPRNGLHVEGRYRLIAQKRRRNRLIRRIAVAVCCVVLAVVAAGGAYAFWFMHSLDNALSQNTDQNVLDDLHSTAANEPFYALVLGSDTRHEENGRDVFMQTDVMMLVRVDPTTRTVTMLSIPRDTPYVLDDGTPVKINALYSLGGLEMLVQQVNKLTGIRISHYAMVYMSDCKAVVDYLGGVTVDVPIEINNNDPETEENVNVQPGVQVLDGRKAQAFAISRHEAGTAQESYRQEKIRTLLEAIIQKVLDRPAMEIPGVVIDLANYVETDMRASDFVALGTAFSKGDVTFYSAAGPSDGDIYGTTDGGAWYCYENPQGWANVMALVDAGKDPSGVNYEATALTPNGDPTGADFKRK